MSNNQLECIICLNPPKLPVATECGHIFPNPQSPFYFHQKKIIK